MIFRKIGIVAVAAATIFGIAVAFSTAATAQYYGGRPWHGGFSWGFGPALPFRFGAPPTRMATAPTTATDIMITAIAARINSASTIPTRTRP